MNSVSTFLGQKRVQSAPNVQKFKNSEKLNKTLSNAASITPVAQKLISPAVIEEKSFFDFLKKREKRRKMTGWTGFGKR